MAEGMGERQGMVAAGLGAPVAEPPQSPRAGARVVLPRRQPDPQEQPRPKDNPILNHSHFLNHRGPSNHSRHRMWDGDCDSRKRRKRFRQEYG